MRTLRSTLLALAVALVAGALGTGTALADTVVIDSVDYAAHRRSRRPTSRSTRATRSASSSTAPRRRTRSRRPVPNWTINETEAPERRADLAHVRHAGHLHVPVQRAQRHDRARSPSPTRRPTRSPRSSCSRKTAGFRHDSIPQGIAAIQALGTANGFTVDRDRGRGPVHRRQPRAVRRRRLPLHDRRRPQRRAADRVRELHQGRRRLRRHPRRDRHRVHVAVVRPDARRLLPQPPGRHADRDGQGRGRQRALDDRHPGLLEPRRRVVQLPAADQPRGQRRRQRLQPA